MDARGRATHGAVAGERGFTALKLLHMVRKKGLEIVA
jgi:hypothetical protein